MNKQQLLEELKSEGFSELIIKAFEKVKRELFVLKEFKENAYLNQPLPISIGATISQPYTIAFMLNLLELDKLIHNKKLSINKTNKQGGSSEYEEPQLSKNQKFSINNKNNDKIKILEIGSGSGYVLVLINEILKFQKIKNTEIYGVERIKELVENSKKVLKQGKNIKIINVDGSKGFLKEAPFDRILVSAAFEKIPENLFKQLKDNGILVTPVRNSIFQFKKIKGKIKSKEFPGFVFVPVIED